MECFASALAFASFALEVVACGWVVTGLRDRDPVEGTVQLPVAAAVERCDATVTGQLRVLLKRSIGPISASSFPAVIAAQPRTTTRATAFAKWGNGTITAPDDAGAAFTEAASVAASARLRIHRNGSPVAG